MKNYWVRSGFFTLLQRGGSMIFGFGGFYLLIRTLSKDDFGDWALFVSVTALIEVARNGLIQNGLIKFSVGADVNEAKHIQNAGLFLNFSLTVFSCLFLLLIGPMLADLWNSPQISHLFAFYCLTTIVLIPFQQSSYLQQANFDFKSMSIMNLMRQGLFFGAIIYSNMMNISITLNDLNLYLFIASFISSIYGYISVRKYFQLVFKLDWSWVSRLFHYGKYSFGTNASGMLFNSIDQMMLGAMMGSAEVALYNASSRINNLLDVPISTMSSIVFPKSTLNANSKPMMKHMYEKSVAALLLFLIPVVVVAMLIPGFILKIVAGSAYQDGAPVLIVILLFTLFQPFMRQFGTVLDAYNKPNVNFFFILLSASLNLILNFVFIKQFGVIGAAFGTLISLAITTIINLIVLHRLFGVSFISILWYMKEFVFLIKDKLVVFINHFYSKFFIAV